MNEYLQFLHQIASESKKPLLARTVELLITLGLFTGDIIVTCEQGEIVNVAIHNHKAIK